MSKTMTKAELAAEMASRTGVSRKDAGVALDALSSILTENVAKGVTVVVPGLGKVGTRQRAARQMRNPSTGETFTKEADVAVKVTVTKSLKDAVNA